MWDSFNRSGCVSECHKFARSSSPHSNEPVRDHFVDIFVVPFNDGMNLSETVTIHFITTSKIACTHLISHKLACVHLFG